MLKNNHSGEKKSNSKVVFNIYHTLTSLGVDIHSQALKLALSFPLLNPCTQFSSIWQSSKAKKVQDYLEDNLFFVLFLARYNIEIQLVVFEVLDSLEKAKGDQTNLLCTHFSIEQAKFHLFLVLTKLHFLTPILFLNRIKLGSSPITSALEVPFLNYLYRPYQSAFPPSKYILNISKPGTNASSTSLVMPIKKKALEALYGPNNELPKRLEHLEPEQIQ
ncbi:hypothetical protein QQP08_004500 [Theobroma cacao]|nr:hypothetical protein QQP08_004500 [Theobroma cacao]